MDTIVLYCKSFIRDLGRVKLLAESIERFNADKIPFYVSVPQSDVSIFRAELAGKAIVVNDLDIIGYNVEQSWVGQQIVKASFWKLGVAKNYLCLDSDAYFIRPFYMTDFIVPGTDICYTVMHEQKDLFGWAIGRLDRLGFDPMESFKTDRLRVMEIFGRRGKIYDFGPAPVLWNSNVWKSFTEDYLSPNNITFTDSIRFVSSEFTWYGEYLLASKKMEIWPVEPLFKVFHYSGQVYDARQFGYTEEHFAKLYLGIIMQGNDQAIPSKYT